MAGPALGQACPTRRGAGLSGQASCPGSCRRGRGRPVTPGAGAHPPAAELGRGGPNATSPNVLCRPAWMRWAALSGGWWPTSCPPATPARRFKKPQVSTAFDHNTNARECAHLPLASHMRAVFTHWCRHGRAASSTNDVARANGHLGVERTRLQGARPAHRVSIDTQLWSAR